MLTSRAQMARVAAGGFIEVGFGTIAPRDARARTGGAWPSRYSLRPAPPGHRPVSSRPAPASAPPATPLADGVFSLPITGLHSTYLHHRSRIMSEAEATISRFSCDICGRHRTKDESCFAACALRRHGLMLRGAGLRPRFVLPDAAALNFSCFS